MKKLVLFLILLCLCVLITKAVHYEVQTTEIKYNKFQYKERVTLNFLLENMSNNETAIYTNYLDFLNSNEDIAKGKDILSESQGLILLYLLNRDNKDGFDKVLKFSFDKMKLKNNTFAWKIRGNNYISNSNALIDDFRILRALIGAHDKWNDKIYMKYIKDISDALLIYNTKGCIPIDFYDIEYGYKSDAITISYLDIYTINRLKSIDKRWNGIYQNSINIILNSKIDNTPFYAYEYNLLDKRYSNEEQIDLIQNMYTLIHLAEENIIEYKDIEWIYDEFEKYNKLYTLYSCKDFKPSTSTESTALYALTARLFYICKDFEKAQLFLDQCEKFRIIESGSELYGCFGNERNKEVYSFDNLQYLVSSSILN
ncbi:glycosyl hydrolase family 8 [Tepidibacter aestuarii]|uniref:glycosyl hydrolase family 8 n=1 Tax=Tepidibacter aestuarii TaxID=2925782 RepID=UPI0020BDD641|nr:glycosyl hydrolase family 8 [Tepidibacter aestuarii]CAH2214547.1 Glycosyl hydrolase family 8 [Tepidibacter aestuarii]